MKVDFALVASLCLSTVFSSDLPKFGGIELTQQFDIPFASIGDFKPRSYWKDHMTLHGLWPDGGDGTYPSYCSKEAFDFEKVTSLIGLDALEEMWPNVQKDEGSKDYGSFWEHEWSKHGTCTGMTQVDYFSTGLKLLRAVGTPDSITANLGGQVTRKDIESFYGGNDMAVLVCEGQFLSQIYLCFAKEDKSGRVMDQIPCPAAIFEHDDFCKYEFISIDTL